MKETQNITLALPKATLKRVRLIAVERGTSVSGLLAESLATLVREEDAYERARRRHAGMLDDGVDLGTSGTINWSRESIHER